MHKAFLSLVAFIAIGTSAVAKEPVLLNCKTLKAVDGDNVRCNGINMRDMGDGAPFVSGYDAPEIQHRKCKKELDLGRLAKKRMTELLRTPGVKVFDSGEFAGKRPLVWVKLPDGRSVGSVLIKEGFAKVWTPEYKPDWCN